MTFDKVVSALQLWVCVSGKAKVPLPLQSTCRKLHNGWEFLLRENDFLDLFAVGVVFHKDSVKRVEHKGGRSILHCKDGTSVSANLVLDATGHARKLVEFDQPFKPGYQVKLCSTLTCHFDCLGS